jgi:uracil-DNA glycosylase
MKIAIVGEAYGEQEQKQRAPFVGAAGYELTKLLGEAGIQRSGCFLTNVFNLRPSGNRVEQFCGGKETAIYGYPILIKGKYVRQEFAPELTRLAEEIDDADPNLIILLGNTACWALLGKTTIKNLRGYTSLSTHTISGYKCLATYHPAAIFRQYELRPIVVADLIKAKREAEYPDIRRPSRDIWIEPTLSDIKEFIDRYILGCRTLSVDIETSGQLITCIGFAPSTDKALVIPFYDRRKKERSYWNNPQLEASAFELVTRVLEDRRIHKVFQNGLYDIAFIWRSTGIKVFGAQDDTMLLHHSLQPESIKDLGFLGSVYTSEGTWKGMRSKTTIKKDD